jgi:aspartyl-tRNA(Asn)/glutamyl-tRNA(Gln) amidotransferase subunit A
VPREERRAPRADRGAAGADDELSFASVRKLGTLLRRKDLSALELARHFLGRLASVGERHNAVAQLTAELAEREARAADRKLRGRDAGPLTGIPYGAKDLLATAGIPTRWGSPAYKDQVFAYDATLIERLRAAGAVLVAKLALVELAGAVRYGSGSASLHGPGRNPWDPERWSGGSSSGSAISVGVGAVPFSIGSETGASLVLPSAFCGVSGLRPSFGAVSKHGALALAWSTDRLGPLAHTADDCALVLAAIAGRDERDATTVDWSFRRPEPHRSFRIGVLPNDFSANPETGVAFERALRVLRARGHRLTKTTLPAFDYATIYRTVSNGETAAIHEDFIRSERIELMVNDVHREALRSVLDPPPFAYARAMEQRIGVTRAVRDMFKTFDALVAPTALIEAPRLETDLTTIYGPRRGGNTYVGALAGLPELSVPMGFSPNDMPLGLSFIGDVFGDGTILRLGIDFQRETDWHLRRPPLAA